MNVSIATQVALSCHSARQRLAETVVAMASGIGRRVEGGIELRVGNDELASAANITTFTASRIMSEWQRDGLLKKEPRQSAAAFFPSGSCCVICNYLLRIISPASLLLRNLQLVIAQRLDTLFIE